MKKVFNLFLCSLFFVVGQAQVSKTLTKTEFLKAPDFKQGGFFGKNQLRTTGSNPALQRNRILLSPQSSVTKQRLDSMVGNSFDKNGNTITSRGLFTYNNAGKMTLRITYNRDATSSNWVYDNKGEFAYDASGNMTLEAYYHWDTTANTWIPDIKNDYTYNADSRMISDKGSIGSQDQWVSSYNTEYVYDQQGNKTTDLVYWLNSTENFRNCYKSEYIYNEFNAVSSCLNGYSFEPGSWTNQSKTDYMYDNHRNDTTEIESAWDYSNLSWKLISKTSNVLSYDQNGKISSKTSTNSRVEYTTGLLVISIKTEYLFDSNGNILTRVNYNWDATTNSLKNNMKDEFQYDYAYSVSDILSGNVFDDFENKDKIDKYKLSFGFGSDWSVYGDMNFFYSSQEINTSTKNPMTGKVNLFPNPAGSSFQINGIEGSYSVTLTDLNGKALFTKHVTGNENIDVNTLPIGMYIVRMITNNGTIERKIVKK